MEHNGAKEWRVDDIFTGADSLETKLDPANFKHVNFLLVEGILGRFLFIFQLPPAYRGREGTLDNTFLLFYIKVL